MNNKKITFSNGLECYYISSKEETEYIFSEIFNEAQYEGHDITIQKGDLIFDVGANIGLFSLFMKQVQANVKIFAFEPIEPTFNVLQKNVDLHDLQHTYLFNYGLSSTNNPQKIFTFYPNMAANSTTKPDDILADLADRVDVKTDSNTENIENLFEAFFQEQEQVTCEVKTLSSVINELRINAIDLLKIDVEGEEYEVFQGIEAKDWPKIKQVVAEIHDQKGRLEQITRLLTAHGFKIKLEKREFLPSSFVDIFHLYAVR